MFSEIAAEFDYYENVLFDYNKISDDGTVTVEPLKKQIVILEKVIKQFREENKDVEINLICHSMGCVVAASLKPKDINKTIFIAPPTHFDAIKTINYFKNRPGTKIDIKGNSSIKRADGTITIVPHTYWDQIKDINMIEIYNDYPNLNKLYIIEAGDEDVLETVDFTNLNKTINLSTIANANHNFTDSYRPILINKIKNIINKD